MPARLFNHVLPPQRIRTFLILFALALAVPLLFIAAFAFQQTAGSEERELQSRVLQVAQSLASDIDRELDSSTITLETLATSEALAQSDFATFHKQATLALRRERTGILLVDRTFQQLLNTFVPFGVPLPKTSDEVTAQKVFDGKQRQVSDLFVGVVSKRPVINVEVPVFEGDTVRYVLIMVLEATRFEQVLRSERLASHWITGITDNKGIIVARSERHADFVGKPLPPELLQQSRTQQSAFRAKSVAGEQILRATVKSEAAGWLVSATIPVRHLEATRRRGELFAIGMITTALVLGSLLAYVFATFMSRPLALATSAAAALGRGDDVASIRSPLIEANAVMGALSSASEELKRKEEHSEFLMRELAHRSKNLLAVVQGMALQTARQAPDVDHFVSQLTQRIQGLGESLDLMVKQNWQGAWLADLVQAHIGLFAAGPRAQVAGPPIFLSPVAVQNMGFALNELATNSSKHGALASAQGRVNVSWGALDDGKFRIEWVEHSGVVVQSPSRQGFGFLVLTQLVARALQGTCNLEFRKDGLYWSLDFPAFHASATKTEETP